MDRPITANTVRSGRAGSVILWYESQTAPSIRASIRALLSAATIRPSLEGAVTTRVP